MLNIFNFDAKERRIAKKIFKTVLLEYGIKPRKISVDITMVTSEEIHKLNLDTRGVDKPTDVLSYPALDINGEFTYSNYECEVSPEDGRLYLGEIIICHDIMLEQAESYGHSKERECAFLITHGMLHILGCDHIDEADRLIMQAKEKSVLNSAKFFRE